MIDFGILALFALQLAMALLCFHSWRGVQAEIRDMRAVKDTICEFEAKIEHLSDLVTTAGEMPKATIKRIVELEGAVGKAEGALVRLQGLFDSVNARVAGLSRGRKKQDAEDQDPAAKAEGALPIFGDAPPGSYPAHEQAPGVPPGFGKVKR